MGKLRVAIIGAGQIARISHIPNYQLMKEAEVIAISDVNQELAEAVAKEFGISKSFINYRDMIESVLPDAVSICVPNKMHCEITCEALEMGCHVICEKPPAIYVKEAEEMERIAAKNKRVLTYGFHFRHSANVEILKHKIENKEFGSIYAAKVQWLRRRGIPGWGNFTNKKIQGGGPLIDIGGHMLDLALYLMDYPKVAYVCANANNMIGTKQSVGLMGKWDPSTYSVEDSLFAYIQFNNKTSMQLETSFALHMNEKDIRDVQIFGEYLGASVFPLKVYGEDNNQLTNMEYPYLPEEDLYQKELRNFVRACLGQEEVLVSAKQGSYVQRVINGLYESAETGLPVLFDE